VLFGGCYLVKDEVMADFVRSLPQLSSFEVEFTPKVGLATADALPMSLKHVAFRSCSRINDNVMEILHQRGILVSLEKLDLTDCPVSAQTLRYIGSTGQSLHLKSLRLGLCSGIDDEGIDSLCEAHLPHLHDLSLHSLPAITDEGICKLLDMLKHLTCLDLSRFNQLTDAALTPWLENGGGKQLTTLNLNGLKEISLSLLMKFLELAPDMEYLDVSWSKSVDNDFLEMAAQRWPRLKEISIWGCNRITQSALRVFSHLRPHTVILGSPYLQ
jgi:DNA repair protein RAD7